MGLVICIEMVRVGWGGKNSLLWPITLKFKKNSKIGVTRCQILRLSAPNSISAGAPPQTTLDELTVPPDHLSVFKGAYLKLLLGHGKRREGKGKGWEGDGVKGM